MEMSQARRKQSPAAQLEAPRFENGKGLLIAGLRGHYTAETMNNIPAQWPRFAPYIGKIPDRWVGAAYGVCWLLVEGLDFCQAFEVPAPPARPENLEL